MFERYTEKARRVIFFARYEASQFGSPCIETEHLLLGLLREDKALATRFLRSSAVESIREQIEHHTKIREQTSLSVDLPLSHECNRVLAFGAEEAERLNHKHIGTEHLLLGLLREEKCFAARMLLERGLEPTLVRMKIARQQPERSSVPPLRLQVRLAELLLAWQRQGSTTVAARPTIGADIPDFAVYKGDLTQTDGIVLDTRELPPPATPEEEIAAIHRNLKLIMHRFESAIANHEFEKARALSNDEQAARARLRQKLKEFNMNEPANDKLDTPVPFLCLEITRHESLTSMQKRIDNYLVLGVEQVWLLDLANRRAYTATLSEGLREFKGDVLKTADPVVELRPAEIWESEPLSG